MMLEKISENLQRLQVAILLTSVLFVQQHLAPQSQPLSYQPADNTFTVSTVASLFK